MHALPAPQLALEDECRFELAPIKQGRNQGDVGTLGHLTSNIFFFQPVDGNMAHHSLLGEQPARFDFMAQSLTVIEADFDASGHASTITIALQRSTPSTCLLSVIPFEKLSVSLSVWYDAESGYRVVADM